MTPDLLTWILNNNPADDFPLKYLVTASERPTPLELLAPEWIDIPTISLAQTHFNNLSDLQRLVNDVCAASVSYGMFQLIHHGIRDTLINNAMRTAKTFFELPTPLLRSECERCGFYSSSVVHHLNIHGEAKYWRDTLPIYLSSTPALWPNNPTTFRNVVEPLASALAQLAEQLICLISGGLGLDESYFANEGLSAVRRLNVNKYPRCPKPRLACGLAKHCDPDLLTLTLVEAGDGARGLEVCINGEWKRITPRPNAVIVTIGSQMRVVSNGKLKAPIHRVAVNSRWDRTSICYAVAPRNDSDVKPAEVLTRTESPRYEKYKYGDYLLNHLGHYRDTTVVLPSYEK